MEQAQRIQNADRRGNMYQSIRDRMEALKTGSPADYDAKVKAGREAFEAKQSSAREAEIWQAINEDRAWNPQLRDAGGSNYDKRIDSSLLSNQQKNHFYALYAEDPEQAEEWLGTAYERQQNKMLDTVSTLAGYNAGTRAVAAVGSAAMGLASGLDPYNDFGQGASKIANALASGGAKGLQEKGLFNTGFMAGTINEDVPIIGGKGLGDLYQLSVSMLQSGALVLAAGASGGAAPVVELLGTTLMGSSAAASDYTDCIENRGMSRDQAMLHATAAGIAEAAFEYVSLDKLVNQDITRGFIKNFFMQGGIEASEELCTTVANRITDAALARAGGYDNQIEQRMKELIALGLDTREAKEKAEREWVTELISDGLGGFLSGGVMTGINTGLHAGDYNRMNRHLEQTGAASMRSGEAAVLRQYAEDNGLGWYGETEAPAQTNDNGGQIARATENGETDSSATAEASAQNDEGTDSSPAAQNDKGEQKKSRAEIRQERQERMGQRQTGSDVERIQKHMNQQMEGKSIQEQQALRDQLQERYGEGILPAAYAAIQEDIRSTTQDKSPDQIRQAMTEALKQTDDREMRGAIAQAYSQAGAEAANKKGGSSEVAKFYQQMRNTGRGGMTMQATVTAQDGTRQQVEIQNFTEDGKGVRLSNGQTVAINKDLNKNLEADADTVDAIQRLAEFGLGKDTDAVFQLYKATSPQTKADGYRWIMDAAMAYDQGRVGRISMLEAMRRSSLDRQTVAQLYKMGQRSDTADTQARQARIDQARQEAGQESQAKVDAKAIKGIELTETEKEQFEMANDIFRAIGVDLVWFASDADGDGTFRGKNGAYLNGKVYLDIHAGRNFASDLRSGILATAGHELTHFLQDYAPKAYKSLRRFLLDQIAGNAANGELTLERLIDDKMRRSSEGITREEALDEVVADACQRMLLDSKALHDYAEQAPGHMKRLRGWVKDWYERIKAAFGKSTELSYEARLMNSLAEDVREAFGDLWDAALREAVETHREVGNLKGEKNTAQEGGKNSERDTSEFEYMKPFAEQLQDFMDKDNRKAIFGKDSLLIGPTPKILQDIGLARLPIAINQTHVGYAIDGTYSGPEKYKDGHTFGITEFSKLPEKLADPVAIIADTSKHDLVIYVDMVNKDNKQTIVPFRVNMAGRLGGVTIDLQLAKTVFGGYNAEADLSAAIINDSPESIRTYYVNKSKIPSGIKQAVREHGLQVPSGIIHSINDAGSPVKQKIREQTETQQFRRWFNESKIVNPDGTPKIMYRGDAEQINVFDRKKAKSSGMYGGGFYFTDSPSHAGQYGQARQYYLSVKSPLQADQHKITRTQMRAFLEAVAENEDYDFEYYGQTATVSSVLRNMFGKGDLEMLMDVSATAIGDLVEAVELFNQINGTKYDGIIAPTETVVFDSRQIKSATDNVGTFGRNNPDGRYSERDYSYDFSDADLILDAADLAADPETAESYWKELLKVMDQKDARDARAQLKGIREQGKKIQELETKLDDALHQMELTDRKLRTQGIGKVTQAVMEEYEVSDAKKRGVAKKATETITQAYQKALEAMDNGAEATAATDILYEGAVEAANILLDEGTHTERHGGKWAVGAYSSYIKEDQQLLIDTMVSKVYEDFALNRYREPMKATAADRLVERTERRMPKKIDEARDRARTVQEANDRLQREIDYAQNEADASKQQVGELAQQLRDLQDQVKEDKQLTGQERSKAQRRIKTLENALKAKRSESQAWKQLADRQARQLEKDAHAQTIQGINSRVELFRARLARTNEELRANKAERALNDTTRKLNETARKLSSTANQLQKQLEREQRILNGMLKPPAIQKLLKAEREKAVTKAEEHKDEVFANYRERKNITALKSRIRNLTADIRRTAASPTERSFLPAHLAGAMVDLLDVLEQGQVDTPKAGTKAASKYYSATDAIRALADAYKQIENDPDYTYSSEFEQDVYDGIVKLANQFVRQTNDGHKYNITANEMSLQELQQVYDTVREIREGFRNAAKLIGMDSSLSTYDYAGKILGHQREIREAKAGKKGKKLRSLYDNIQIDALSPIRAAHMMDGFQDAEFYQLWKQVEAGLGQKNRVIMDSTKRLQSFKTGQNELTYLKALREKSDYGIRDVNGKPVLMTKMQAIQMLMTWQREEANQNLVHMQEGGVIIRDADLISRGRYSDAKKTQQKVKVTPKMIQQIASTMTEWDKGYMKAARDVFSSLLEQSNKVLYTLKRKVHKGEAMYIPEKVAEGYLAQEVVKGGEFNLGVKEASATKDLKQKSTLPIIIDGLETMMNRHINDMANYIGLAVPIRNFAKVYNTRTSGIGVDATTVNDEITNTWGDKAGEMMMETLRQVQNGRSYEYQTVLSGLEQKIQSAFVKASLVGKISVFIKQAASYAAAGSVLSQKALDRSQQYIFAIVSAPNGKLARSVYNRIDALTPEHFIRRMGMSMEEIAMDKLSNGPIKGKLQTAGAWLEGKGKVGKAVRHTGAMLNPTNWIQRMDVATTGALVIACEKQATYDGFKRGTPEFDAHVKELYERVIRETQPMYDPLHRPALQKNAGPMARLLFPFRTVPFQNYGQIMDSFGSLQSASKENKKAAAVHFGKTVWANFESALVFAALGMLSYAIMHKPKRYLDDDDELTLESVLKTYGSDVLDVTLGNLMPYGGTELKDFVERWINGDKWYQLMSVGPADLVNETASSILKMKDASDRFSAGELSGDGLKNQIINTTMQVTKLLGLPVSNVRDIFRGVSAGVDDWRNGQLLWLNDDTVDRSNATNARRLIKAAEAGDPDKVEVVTAEMRKNILADKPGMKEEKVNGKIQAAVGAYLKEQYLAGALSEQRASDYLVRYGNAENEDEAYWKIREWEAKTAHAGDDEYSFSPYENLRAMVAEGKDISAEAKRLIDHGKSKDTVEEEKKKAIKALFVDGKISENSAEDKLSAYLDLDNDEAYWEVDKWKAKEAGKLSGEEVSDSNYRDLYAAIDANKPAADAMAELLAHGYKERDVYQQAKDHLVERFEKKLINETQFRNQLSQYAKIVKKSEVDEIVTKARCYMETGHRLGALRTEYQDGEITAQQAKNWMIKYDGKSTEDANKAVRYWDYLKRYPSLEFTDGKVNNYEDGTTKAKENGHLSAKSAGMSFQQYLEAKAVLDQITDSNGNGTGEDEYIVALSQMNLTARQKDALYYERYKGTTKYSRKTW